MPIPTRNVDHVAEAAHQAPASDRLVERIGDCIFSGEFPPGAKLTEVELAKRFGVSRAPLREALFRLEERQLIERARQSTKQWIDRGGLEHPAHALELAAHHH